MVGEVEGSMAAEEEPEDGQDKPEVDARGGESRQGHGDGQNWQEPVLLLEAESGLHDGDIVVAEQVAWKQMKLRFSQ